MKAKNKLIHGYEVKTNIYGFTVVTIHLLTRYSKLHSYGIDDENIDVFVFHEDYPDVVERIEFPYEKLLEDEYYKVLIDEDRDFIHLVVIPKSFIFCTCN